MKRLFIFFFIFLTTAAFSASPQNFLSVKLSRLLDGDTFTVDLPCTDDVFCKDIAVRVRGIDTPESRSKNLKEKAAGLKAKQFAKVFLESGQVDLLNCTRDKYFRLLCDVSVDGKDFATAILKAKLARPYNGGKKQK